MWGIYSWKERDTTFSRFSWFLPQLFKLYLDNRSFSWQRYGYLYLFCKNILKLSYFKQKLSDAFFQLFICFGEGTGVCRAAMRRKRAHDLFADYRMWGIACGIRKLIPCIFRTALYSNPFILMLQVCKQSNQLSKKN